MLLRRAVLRDAQDRLACGADPELTRLYGGDPSQVHAMTADDAEGWAQKMIDSDNPYSWVIAVNAGEADPVGKCVGTVRLHSLDAHDHRARYAIGIFDAHYRGKGYGREVTKLVLDYAFGVLNLHRVDLRVLEFNSVAIACYQACGFAVEGRERESCCIQGEWYDDIMMSILQEEWQQLDKRYIHGQDSIRSYV